ncbi:unnamed protein product [Paramecium sonneborni]|uniref:Transmembrane protein n=1 Tax=Paramecium sonneborni TaxID=65129 RepID=A0A8S1R3L1_9CILI|nr:unnamed protein product [Paramecium sonneborni]
MILTLLLIIQKIKADCISNQFLTFPKQVELAEAVKTIQITVEGGYIIGYGNGYQVKDKSKIIIQQVPSEIIFEPSYFEIYCPAIHQLQKKNSIKCEIQLNMEEVEPEFTPKKAKFVIPIESDKQIKYNPLLEIQNNFQIRLMDLAEQLENLMYYLEYENCDNVVYIIPQPLQISLTQITQLQKYSKSIPEGALTREISDSYKGELYLENFSLDPKANNHHYGLIAIVIGITVLAAIRALTKKKEQQCNLDKQPLNQHELQKLT